MELNTKKQIFNASIGTVELLNTLYQPHNELLTQLLSDHKCNCVEELEIYVLQYDTGCYYDPCIEGQVFIICRRP